SEGAAPAGQGGVPRRRPHPPLQRDPAGDGGAVPLGRDRGRAFRRRQRHPERKPAARGLGGLLERPAHPQARRLALPWRGRQAHRAGLPHVAGDRRRPRPAGGAGGGGGREGEVIMDEPETWRPLLAGEEAAEAWQAILEVAAALRGPVDERLAGDPTVGSGNAGIALFYSYLAQALAEDAWAD